MGTRPGRMAEEGWRSTSVEKALQHVEPLMSRIHATPPVDIRFADTLGVPVHLSLRAHPLDRCGLEHLMEWGQLQMVHYHFGKGVTEDRSRLSCMMEAVERYSSRFDPLDERLVEASFAALGTRALDPRQFYLPPGVDFSPDRPLLWVCATDLTLGEEVLAPVDLVLMDIPDSAYPFPGFQTKRLGFFFSNGLAAGMSASDAIRAGICEVVEREAQFRIVHGIPPEPMEVSPLEESELLEWLDLFQRNRLTLRLFSTCPVEGFHAAAAVSWDHYNRVLLTGMAADPSPLEALRGAILELVQQRARMFFLDWRTKREYHPVVRYIRDRIPPDAYQRHVPTDYWTERCRRTVAFSSLEEAPHMDVDSMVETLRSQGRRVAALDLTDPELGIPVVRVLISGMRNAYQEFVPALSFIHEGLDRGCS